MKIKITKEDRDWSKSVRERDKKCQYEGCIYHYTQLQAHHIFPRVRRGTRHDIENGISYCPHHHTLGTEAVHRNPLKFKKMMIKKLGLKKYRELEQKSLGVK